MASDLPQMLTIREAAKLGVMSEYGLRLWERQGKLPCVHVGRKVLVNVDKLFQILNDPKGGNL